MKLETAVITTHKRPVEIIERALKSVLSQTYTDMEIIVVDDSPADYEFREDVKRMIKSYTSQNLKYVQHEKCMGACAARNTGIKHAKGEFIAFLDDDDEWKSSKIEKQLKEFIDDDIALVYCGQEIKNDVTGIVESHALRGLAGYIYPELIKKNFIGSTSFPLLRKSALEQIGGFDILMQSSQDYDVWLRLAKKYKISFVDESLVVYHVHDNERITSNCVRKINGLERVNEKNWDYIQLHKDVMWSRLMPLVPYYAGNKQLGEALKVWIRAAFLQPFAFKKNIFYFSRLLKMSINR